MAIITQRAVKSLVLGVFIMEAVLKIFAVAPKWRLYFGNGWNLFDFTIVVLALLPSTGEMAMPALYPQITSQNPCTRVRPRRGARIMVVPLASTATQVWLACCGCCV